jgi:hypothetical protein
MKKMKDIHRRDTEKNNFFIVRKIKTLAKKHSKMYCYYAVIFQLKTHVFYSYKFSSASSVSLR